MPTPGKWAAVAVIIRLCRGIEVLIGKRRDNPADPWSGDAAFPGGRFEPYDKDLVDTAIREAYEETGIDLRAHGKLVTVLDIEHPGNRPELNVLPIVFLINCNIGIPKPHSDEFEKLAWVSLDKVVAMQRRVLFKDRLVDAFVVDGMVIWGMTRRILLNIHDILVVKGCCRHLVSRYY